MKYSILLLFFLLLSSCHTVHHNKTKAHSVRPKQSVSQNSSKATVVKNRCMLKCEQRYKSCRSQCHDSCRKCQKKANKNAWANYCAYYKRMKIQGTYRPRDWLSFRDPLVCRQVSCNCPADLNVCIQHCGGKIKKKLRATPYCQ